MIRKTLAAIVLYAVFCVMFYFLVGVKIIQPVWVIATYLLSYFIVSLFSEEDFQQEKEDDKQKDWPTSGPIGEYSRNGLLIMFYGSGVLSIFNPFQLFQMLKQGIGNLKFSLDTSKLIENAHDHHNETEYILPFEKDVEWLVYNGGVERNVSHSWDVITQRFAYDFVIADAKFHRHENKGTNVEDYYCYSQNIVAVADGTIVQVGNGQRDAPCVGYGIVDVFSTSFVGNYVVIKHTDKEYSFYAHLIKGSVKLKEGEKVEQGQFVGKCGHSGHSSEPHLHFHLQDQPDFFVAKGLPIRFSHIKINDKEVNLSYISVSDRVCNV